MQLFARLWLYLRSGGKPLSKRRVSILEKSAFGEQGWAGTGKGSSPQTAAVTGVTEPQTALQQGRRLLVCAAREENR